MSQSIVNEVLAKKPKRRVEWVQKRLKEDLAITHRDSVYEVLVRKEGRAFAADISGADCVRTYNAVLAAIELFTTKQQKRLQEDTFLLRKIHTQEQERQKAAQAKAKAAVKRPTKDPPASLQRPPATKDSPKVAAKRTQSPDPQVPAARRRSTSPTANVLSSEPKSERRSESPDWIPRTPPRTPPKEPRKTTGSWTTIFQDPTEEKLSSARKETSTAEGGTKKEEETKESKPESDEESSSSSSSSSTQYDAFTAGPEQVAVTSPSRNQQGTTQSLQSPDRPSEPPAKSVKPDKAVKRAARSSSSERSASTKKKSVAPSLAPQRSGSDLVEKSKEAKNKAETETGPPCNGSPGSPDSDSDSSEDSAGNVDSQGIAEGMAVNTLDDQNNVEGEQGEPGEPGEQEEQPGSSESDSESQASQAQEPEVAPTQPEEEQEPPATPQVTSIPLRRQPPPPPPPRRLLAEAGTSEALRWRYVAPDGQERLAIRAYPGIDAPTTGGSLGSGEVFTVNQESPGENGVIFLRLADGRGWVFNRTSGLSRRRKTRPLCVPYQVSLVDEQGSGKVRKRLPRPANAHPKAKRRRRQHAVVDPYMVTSTVIEVDSDGDAPKAPAGGNVPKAAKESLRVQLERKQQEVEALRQKLSQLNTQKELGKKRSSSRAPEGDPKTAPKRTAQAAKLKQDADDKRRELQAILTKKRAINAAGLQKQTPRYVD